MIMFELDTSTASQILRSGILLVSMDRIDLFLSDCRWLRIGFRPGGLTENPPPHALQRYLALPSLVLPMETNAPLVPTGTR